MLLLVGSWNFVHLVRLEYVEEVFWGIGSPALPDDPDSPSTS